MNLTVSPLGLDVNPGTVHLPLRTLAKALAISRENNPGSTIVLRGGEYENTSVTLDARDSGLTIQGFEGENAILRGGSPFLSWEQEGPYWCATLEPDAPLTFKLLEVNGRFAPRSRYPKTGVLTHASVFSSQWMSTSAGGWDIKPTPQQLTHLQIDPNALPLHFHWDSAEVTIFHKWDETLTGITDYQEGNLTLSIECGHPPGAFGVNSYVVWNTPEGMEPGCFRVDTAQRKVYYQPLPGEQIEQARIYIPKFDSIIRILPGVENLTIRNISFQNTTSPMILGGFGAAGIPGAIHCDSSLKNCTFENLKFRNLSTWAISLQGENKNIFIQDCQVADTGAGGILLENGIECSITGNRIERVGRIYPSAIGIIAQGCRVSQNVLRDLPYTGICYSGGSGAQIVGNTVIHAVSELNDGAGIYATFSDNGTLRGNTVENIPQSAHPESTRNGLYLDEQCRNWLVEDNVTRDCSSAMMNHMCTGNTIQNNTFSVSEGNLLVSFLRCGGYQIKNNTFQAQCAITLAGCPEAVSCFQDNKLISAAKTTQQVLVSEEDYSRSVPTIWDSEHPFS